MVYENSSRVAARSRTRSEEPKVRTRSESRSAAPKSRRDQNNEKSRKQTRAAKGNSKRTAATAKHVNANAKVKASAKLPKSAKPKAKGKGSSIIGAILFVPAAIAGLFKKGSTNASQRTLAPRKRFASLSAGKVAVLGVLLVLALGVALVYPSAKNYYVAVRTYDRSQAELNAIYDRNAQLQDRIDTLKTKAGMEDYVRAQYGWTKNKENAVRVTGLPTSTNKFELPANIPSGSVVAEDSILNDVLDAIFFVRDDVPTASDTTLANSTRALKAASEAAESESAEGEPAEGEATASEGSADEQPSA